jgi:hypothetical protein
MCLLSRNLFIEPLPSSRQFLLASLFWRSGVISQYCILCLHYKDVDKDWSRMFHRNVADNPWDYTATQFWSLESLDLVTKNFYEFNIILIVHRECVSLQNRNFAFIKKTKKNSMVWVRERTIPTDRATAACRRSDCLLLRIEGATWSAWRIPTAVFSVLK